MPPTPATPRAPCCSTSIAWPGTPSSSSCSTCPSTASRRRGARPVPSATPARPCSGDRFPSRRALGDQQASLFGHGCFEPSAIKATYGTGAFIWLNAGNRPDVAAADGLLRTVAWHLDEPCYALEGFVMYAGAILEWLAARLSISGGGIGVVERAQQAGSSGGVILVPAFQGLAGPWWRPDARAALVGMTESTSVGHICHAGLEAICFQVRTLLEFDRAVDRPRRSSCCASTAARPARPISCSCRPTSSSGRSPSPPSTR